MTRRDCPLFLRASRLLGVSLFGLGPALGGCGSEGTPAEEAPPNDRVTDPLPNPCADPRGASGIGLGDLMDPALAWQGYRAGQDEGRTIWTRDYLDCDGSRGVNAVLVTVAATWCPNCRAEARALDERLAGEWQGLGIEVLTLMIQDRDGTPATNDTVWNWKRAYGADHFAVAADPDFTFGTPGANGLPLGIIVNPRTLEIVARTAGYAGDYPALEELAKENATH